MGFEVKQATEHFGVRQNFGNSTLFLNEAFKIKASHISAIVNMIYLSHIFLKLKILGFEVQKLNMDISHHLHRC